MKWRCKLQRHGLLLLTLLGQARAMDAATQEVLTKVMELSAAATTAAKASADAIQTFEASSSSTARSNFGEASKVLKQPETFSTDDPVQFMLWREQFLNWLVFSDSRYGKLVEMVEGMAEDVGNDLTDSAKELAERLFSILSSVFLPERTSSTVGKRSILYEEWFCSMAEAEAALRAENQTPDFSIGASSDAASHFFNFQDDVGESSFL